MSFDLILKNVSRHIALTPAEEDIFISLLRTKEISRRDFLLRPGEISRCESFVSKGCLRMYHVDDKGVEHIVLFAVEEWWAGDMYSFLTQRPASLYIEALEDTQVLQIDKASLDRLYAEVPKFERFFRILLQNAFVAQQNRILQNLSFTAEERYREFMDKYPGVDQRVPQKMIAAYLGITPEFLSVLRKKRAGR
ncbi:MAG: Crp/Fnr family transcriptional regulator [Chitinophagaceae bacterium]|nr:Crp/Fnr family transcriptional regulator [Chitinophagaceae bacterium]